MTARLLIVDDEVDTCENLRDIFCDFGYDVDMAHDGESALKLVGKKDYDVALLDLRMPGMDGLELYRRIRQQSAGTVAIVVTAYATSETAASIKEAGAWRIMSKPVDLDALIGLVNSAVDQPLILIIDDDKDLCENLWDLFREHELRVCLAHDAGETAQRLRDSQHQVVIIDLKLPGANGLEVLRQVRSANPSARTVMITGHREEMAAAIDQAVSDGIDAVAYKPFDVANLISTVRNLANKAS